MHEPLPQVVMARLIGTVVGSSVGLATERAVQQLGRAAHVVLDLGEVLVLDTGGVNLVPDPQWRAIAHRVRRHVVGADHDALGRDVGCRRLSPYAGSPSPMKARPGRHCRTGNATQT